MHTAFIVHCQVVAATSCIVQDQGNSDSVLDDVACMMGCTRSSLNGNIHNVHHNVHAL